MSEENKVRDAVDAVTGLVKAMPIYEDALRPAAKEVGGALQTVAKTLNIVLAPVSALVWGYDQIRDWVQTRVAEKLKVTPPEDIQPPSPNVAGPALEALKYTGHEPTLRELYANLLAASLDKQTSSLAHPSFVEFIKQMTPDEAKLMKLFSLARAFPVISVSNQDQDATKGGLNALYRFSLLGVEAECQYPQLTPSYLDNLCRLGLVDIPQLVHYTNPDVYKTLEDRPEVVTLCAKINAIPNRRSEIIRETLTVTQLGRQFIQACVIDHEHIRTPATSSAVQMGMPFSGNISLRSNVIAEG